jgi:hypothetical protein
VVPRGCALGFLTRRCVPVCEWDSVSHTARSQEGSQRREAGPEPGSARREGPPVREARQGSEVRLAGIEPATSRSGGARSIP